MHLLGFLSLFGFFQGVGVRVLYLKMQCVLDSFPLTAEIMKVINRNLFGRHVFQLGQSPETVTVSKLEWNQNTSKKKNKGR